MVTATQLIKLQPLPKLESFEPVVELVAPVAPKPQVLKIEEKPPDPFEQGPDFDYFKYVQETYIEKFDHIKVLL